MVGMIGVVMERLQIFFSEIVYQYKLCFKQKIPKVGSGFFRFTQMVLIILNRYPEVYYSFCYKRNK